MADPYFTQEQTQIARVVASGGFGAGVLIYLRHPGTAVRAVALFAMGCGNAAIFTSTVAPLVAGMGIGEIPVAAALGLLGKAFAEKALGVVERLDLMSWIGRKAG